MARQRVDDPRFDGAGLVMALVNLCCFVAGLVVGGFLSAVLS